MYFGVQCIDGFLYGAMAWELSGCLVAAAAWLKLRVSCLQLVFGVALSLASSLVIGCVLGLAAVR